MMEEDEKVETMIENEPKLENPENDDEKKEESVEEEKKEQIEEPVVMDDKNAKLKEMLTQLKEGEERRGKKKRPERNVVTVG